jgi:L-threonylcarbamoyladenylate synthase
MPVSLDWRQAPTPDDVVRAVSSALGHGAVVALPSEAGYVLAADPQTLTDPTRPAGLPDGLTVFRVDGYFDATDFYHCYPDLPPADRVLVNRVWPGPVGYVHPDAPYPVWVPGHPILGAVLADRRDGLALFELPAGFDPNELGDSVALVVVDEPRPGPITLLRSVDGRWTMVREGVRTPAEIAELLARRIVFVCTGNTCRSPMAEGLFKAALAARLGCDVADLPARGYLVTSAGVSAYAGDAATAESVEALRVFGVDLSGHRSRPAAAELIARADDVIAMTRGHLLALLSRAPVLAGAFRLLGGADGDLDDPIGRGPEVYRACADAVRRHVERLITEMGLS